jgi:tRNA threonylcarbamoyl adenosine modification protein YeaZ
VLVLALDSTTPRGSLALRLGDGSLHVRAIEASRSWAERLPGDVLDFLREHHLRPPDVEVFAVATGPGSLTGLRVGIATVQGFALATGRPVAGVSALDALAEHGHRVLEDRASVVAASGPAGQTAAAPAPIAIGAWANAMRGEVFTALYAGRPVAEAAEDPWRCLAGPEVGSPAAAAAGWQRLFGPRPIVVVGDVDDTAARALRDAFGQRAELHPRPLLAPSIVSLALRRASRGALVTPHAVQPVYVRKPDAVLARERTAAAGASAPPERSAR